MNEPQNRIELGKDGNIVIVFPPDLGKHEKAKDITSARYDRKLGRWVVNKEYLLSVINQFPGFACSSEVAKLTKEFEEGEALSKSKAASVVYATDISVVNGRKLFKHQIEGVYAILQKKRLILSHEMGLGKTTTSLIAGKLSDLPIYVVAPKNLHVAWQREADLVGVKVKSIISWAKIPEPPTEDFFCIMDEAQAMQTLKRGRTQKALAFADKARYVVCVTGTPAKNGKASNMFGMLAAIKHPESFRQRVYDKVYAGASNLPALYQATKDKILFKKKEDCLDLPEKIRALRIAALTPESEVTYNTAFNIFRDKWKAKVQRKEIISSNEKLVMFMQLRHATSWAKIHAAVEVAEELHDNGKQAVFFVNFTDTADAFAKAVSGFATVGKITGDVNQINRQKTIDTFQSGGTRFIVATFGAGGLGITLTAAHHVVLVDRPWTPGDAVQAEDRCHRIGQKDTVLVDWIQCGIVDQKIDALLLRKQGNISTIMTGNKDELPLNFDIRNKVDDVLNEIFN